MARLGVMTTEFDTATFSECVSQIAAHGVRSVQLQLGSVIKNVPTSDALLRGLDALGDQIDEPLAVKTRAVLYENSIDVAAVDGTYNMADSDPARRQRNLRHLINVIELAGAFGTDIVTICTGSRADIMWFPHGLNGSEEAWRDLVEQLQPATAAATAAGVTLAFEPEFNNVVDSAHRARRLIDEVGSPSLKVLMDAANIFHIGDLSRQQDHLQEAFALIGDDIVLAHAKDLDHDGDAGGRAAGQGLLDYSCYLSELQRCGYDGAIVLHQLNELAPDRRDIAFRHVVDHAPTGYLN